MAPDSKVLPEIPVEEMPLWCNDQLFYDCLKPEHINCKKLSTKIISVRRAVPPGENYLSIIYRIKVDVNDECGSKIQNFIIKQVLETAADTLKDDDIFTKEALVYNDILPKFVKHYNDIGEKIEFGPKLYKVLDKPDKLYIFEDLNVRNFFVKDRKDGIDLAHLKIFYQKLAKFHAASVVHYEKHGAYDRKFFTSMFTTRSGEAMKQLFDGLFPFFLEAIQNSEKLCHLYDKIVSKNVF